ncbi:hypothetical protein PACTADRAFT_50547 [Pachysolen tannophilus NRRL Y-2460]|uniref:Xylanolytic transcriptional activator regulatory domain-containing protein n=1 Tax=Pachysolen tannophilus NRRL Y-2460 TaxID=669874 RepID=A0A1E4TSH1_PACTA|nr:hypothetical protein PACTADRAFT_50547 [Pachysolen tannophilus NRRL Y-2460]
MDKDQLTNENLRLLNSGGVSSNISSSSAATAAAGLPPLRGTGATAGSTTSNPLETRGSNAAMGSMSEHSNVHEHDHEGPCCCNNYPHSVHERPVSIAGSVDFDTAELSDDESLLNDPVGNNRHLQFQNDGSLVNSLRRDRYNSGYNISFEQINAPGAAAAISIQNKMQNKNFINLSTLVAMSIPRTTEETLFIPSLLAKICNVHGFNSKAAYLTAKSIAGLKESYQEANDNSEQFEKIISFKNINFNRLTKQQSLEFFQNLNLPNQINLDLFLTHFFDNWNKVMPVLNKQSFLNKYFKFNKSREVNFQDGAMYGDEKFAETLILIITLVMLSQERSNSSSTLKREDTNNNGENIKNQTSGKNALNNSDPFNSHSDTFLNCPKIFRDNSNFEILQYYDHIIHEFIISNISSVSSLTTLQNLSLELLYCLSIGDLTTSYEIRGKLITMGQQLRLHRCPSAVLGNNGSTVSTLQQGERRILFWCIYTLDTFSALILGVPRLLKDYEIECALPFSNEDNLKEGHLKNGNQDGQNMQSVQNTGNDTDETNMVVINNNTLSLVGKVCNLALAVMRYSKILGNIVDSIFRRTNIDDINSKKKFLHEESSLIYENLLDTWRKNLPPTLIFELDSNGILKNNEYSKLSEKQLLLVFLYYYAKILIYLPIMSTDDNSTKGSSSYIIIQQSTGALLNITNILSSHQKNYYYLPLPLNLSREKARFALLSAKGTLEYTRGGALFQDSKALLQSIINELKIENGIGMLGCLSDNCIETLDSAIEAILSSPAKDNVNSNSSRRGSIKKSSKTQMGHSVSPSSAITVPASNETSSLNKQNSDIKSENTDTVPGDVFKMPHTPNNNNISNSPTSNILQRNLPNTIQSQARSSSFSQSQHQQSPVNSNNYPSLNNFVSTNSLNGVPVAQQQQQQQQQQQPQQRQQSLQQNQKNGYNNNNLFNNNQLMDFIVDGSLGLPSLLDFDFDFDFSRSNNNTSPMPQQLQHIGSGNSNFSDSTPSSYPSANNDFGKFEDDDHEMADIKPDHAEVEVAHRSGSLFSWQQQSVPQQSQQQQQQQ